MSVIVTDAGFAQDDFTGNFAPLNEDGTLPDTSAIDINPADDVAALAGQLEGVTMIRVAFPAFSDGRGFTHARSLRLMGYTGRLRAAGHIIADQYAMARRAGFDEVEIDDGLAARQPAPQWLARANWQEHDYQSRLRAR